jgi:AraC-like DNA-binding protein
LQTSLPAVFYRAQTAEDYLPRVDDEGWENWIVQSHWVLEADEEEQVLCQLRSGRRCRAPFAWRRGTWHLYAPGTGYRLRYPRPLRAHRNRWVIFDLQTPLAGLRPRALAVFADEEQLLADQVELLARLQTTGAPGDRLQAAGVLLRLVGLLVNAAQQREGGTVERPWRVADLPRPPQPDRRSLLAQLDEALLLDLSAPPAVAELARRLGMSASSLAHRLRAETGWTVVNRTRSLRIAEAQRQLVADPARPLKALAHHLGFSSPQYFIRVFREVTGMTPREFETMSAYRRSEP